MPDVPIVFLNGRMLPAAEAHLNIHDLGVILGATVSEMARTFAHRLFRLESHLDRLAQSIQCIGFDVGVSVDDIGRAAREVVEHNAKLLPPDGELALIIFITAGENPTYAAGPDVPVRRQPTVCAHTFPLPFHLWAESMREGVRLVTPSIRHVPPACVPPCVKHRSRIHYYLADREARSADPAAVPLLLDLAGNVAETNTANFLMVERGTIVSPTPANILPGISRETVVELAGNLGIPFVEQEFDVARALRADEAFLASTPYCLMPAVQINGHPIGDGQPGSVFRRLIEAWSREVGVDVYRQIVTSTSIRPRREPARSDETE